MNVQEQILQKIREYDRILLFRHIRVDGDCVGSTRGLQQIIRLTWPEKEVIIIDEERSEYLAFLGTEDADSGKWEHLGDLYDDRIYEEALGIVIDTASPDRVANQKYSLCREVIKIDHHINREPYGQIAWVEEERSSACEMVAAFYAQFQDVLKIDSYAATCIYTGMVTDSGRFQYEGVKGDTLRLAGLMLDQGVDTETLYAQLYLKEFSTLKLTAYVYEKMQFTANGVAWVHIDESAKKRFSLNTESASSVISNLSGIKGCLCWLAFIDMPDGSIRVRLRSRFMSINEVAENYNGGGHACASGATVYNREEMASLIRDADEKVREYKENHEGWL